MNEVEIEKVMEAEFRSVSETKFTDEVRRLARTLGWFEYHTYNSRRSTAGFPDLALVREPWLVFAELKTEIGNVTPSQFAWLREMQTVADHADNVWVWVWRPHDMEGIARFLNTPDQFDDFKDMSLPTGYPFEEFTEAATLAKSLAEDKINRR
jgi:hypothetical protein